LAAIKLTDKSGYPDNGYPDMQTLTLAVFKGHILIKGGKEKREGRVGGKGRREERGEAKPSPKIFWPRTAPDSLTNPPHLHLHLASPIGVLTSFEFHQVV